MPRFLAVLPLFLGAGCVFPGYTASRSVDLTVPAAGLTAIDCTSHNGSIRIEGSADATQVEVHAVLSVRGYSQSEADENLHLMSVGKDFANGKLSLFGSWPNGSLSNLSPGVEFTVKAPRDVALTLTSHNGDLHTRGTSGDQRLLTHNGDIDAAVAGHAVTAESHNGRIGLEVATEGPVEGSAESHNGSVDVHFGAGASATVTASTHNGDLVPGESLKNLRIASRSLTATVGDGTGRLTLTTHNGDVKVR